MNFEQVTVCSRAEWRAWLTANHTRPESIWLVTYKKRSGLPHVSYAEIVEEALCFGWIDSRPGRLDEQRTMLLLSPRRPKSPWSKLNKERVAKLIEAGQMAAPGLEKIERAQVDGSWSALDAVEAGIIPEDLAVALRNNPEATRHFDAFAPSAQKGILQWIDAAKRQQTRQKRIAETVALAALNIKANFPRKD